MNQTTDRPIRQTILIANSDPIVSESIHDILSVHFDILSATSGEDALGQSENSKVPIALLVSAIELPEMSGIELGVKITALRPKIKVLLTSAFKGGMLVLNEGWHFLPTPFFESQLSTLIIGLIEPPPSKFVAVALGGRKQTWN
jgi:DNA-binding NtrC family response regulator